MVNVIYVIINLIPYWGSDGERIVVMLCTVDHPVRSLTGVNRQSGNRTVRVRKKTVLLARNRHTVGNPAFPSATAFARRSLTHSVGIEKSGSGWRR